MVQVEFLTPKGHDPFRRSFSTMQALRWCHVPPSDSPRILRPKPSKPIARGSEADTAKPSWSHISAMSSPRSQRSPSPQAPPWLGQPSSWLWSTSSMLHRMYTCFRCRQVLAIHGPFSNLWSLGPSSMSVLQHPWSININSLDLLHCPWPCRYSTPAHHKTTNILRILYSGHG
jgi:hypothetical protein